MEFDAENAISFLTAAVRIPTEWRSPLMRSEKDPAPAQDERVALGPLDPGSEGTEQERWEKRAYTELCDHFDRESEGSRLLGLGDVAQRIAERFPAELKSAGIPDALLMSLPLRKRGMLDYHRLSWLDSTYFPAPKVDGQIPTSSVVAFKPLGISDSPPWREYLLDTPGTQDSFHEFAAIYDILALMAQRRSLISISAQRRLCKIVLPWGTCRFTKRNGKKSRLYLLVPVITMLSRRGTTKFRRTLTLSVFLLPRTDDPLPVLDTNDLASLCQQAAWNDQSPKFPRLVRSSGPPEMLFDGPLEAFLSGHLRSHERHLPIVFDAILQKFILALDVVPRNVAISQSLRMLVAIGRARSVVFGSVLHVDGEDQAALWNELTMVPVSKLAIHIGKLLSVNAARHGRELLVGGPGFRLDRMRVTNPYEEDVNTIVLYNPMARFMVNIMPRRLDKFPTVSLKLGVAWLNLLAGATSSIKEILRSYRYEIEQLRNQIELLTSNEDPGALLKSVHRTTLTILEEIDVVYSFDLVTPTYKAAHARILKMEGIAQERDILMRELEMTTALLRAEESDQLSRQIARNSTQMTTASELIAVNSTKMTEANASIDENSRKMAEANARIAESTSSTDKLTVFVAAFGVLSLIVVVDTLIDFGFREKASENHAFLTMLIADVTAILVAAGGALWYWRSRTNASGKPAARRSR